MSGRPIEPTTSFDKEADTGVASEVSPKVQVTGQRTGQRESDFCKRPTLSPPFDLEAFAKEKMEAGEAPRRAPPEAPTEPPPEPASGSRLRTPERDPLEDARKKFLAGDFAGALILAEAWLEEDAADIIAQAFADECKRMLEKTYITRLGSLERVAVLAIDQKELRTLPLDHRSGFLLSHIDGISTLEMILDMCGNGMSRLEALRTIFGFVEEGVITLE